MKIYFEEKPAKDKEYPYLGINENVYIVLFIKPGAGIQLNWDIKKKEIFYSEKWNESVFTPIHGKLIIDCD